MRPASKEAFLDEVDSVLRVLARAAHHGMIDLVVASDDGWRSDPDASEACDVTACDDASYDDDFSDVSD